MQKTIEKHIKNVIVNLIGYTFGYLMGKYIFNLPQELNVIFSFMFVIYFSLVSDIADLEKKLTKDA